MRAAPSRTDEIGELVTGYTSGKIPDYQMSALLMAILWRGMSRAETVALTLAMAASGEQLRIRERVSPVADKHSTGGVGDKVTLAVAPLVAACGCRWRRCLAGGWATPAGRWTSSNRSAASARSWRRMSSFACWSGTGW